MLRSYPLFSAALPADAHRLVLSPWDEFKECYYQDEQMKTGIMKGMVLALHAVPDEHRVAELRFVLICSFRSGKIEVPVYFH